MSASVDTAGARNPWLTVDAWRRLFRDRPLVPLLVLLAVLVVIRELARPGIFNPDFVGVTVRAAVPLAILAGCQTLAMLTGGIDLSVGAIASMAAFVMATLNTEQGPAVAIAVGLFVAILAGLVNGVGIGIFKVHPLIMTLGMGLVLLGLTSVYQLAMVQSPVQVPELVQWLGSETTLGFLPNNLLVFIPVAAAIIIGLRRSGYGRLLFAVGDNPVAARLSGARVWQVLVALYVISAVLAALAGFLVAGLVKTATIQLVEESVLPSVAAAVIGGTSIMGGRGGYAGTIVGALILTVLTTLLTVLDMPEAAKQMLFGLIIVLVAAAYTRVTGGVVTQHLGIDLGVTNLKWAVVEDTEGTWTTLARGQVPTLAAEGPEAVVGRIAATAATAVEAWPQIVSLGIGVPGLYDPATGSARFLINMPGDWAGRPIAPPIAARLGIPVALINDARAFGLAELRLGAGRGASSMVGLTLGTGVGGVIAINGRVHLGHDGTAGEIGHHTIDPDGELCGCGDRGCLETFAAAHRIAAACGTATAEEAVLAARAGDARALVGLAEVGRWLGIGISNMIRVISPDRVVIGGGVAAAGDLLLDPIRAEIRRRVFTTPLDAVEIVTAELGTWAGAIGAGVHGAEMAVAV